MNEKMEFKKGVGFLSYYVTEVQAESVQFLDPRSSNANNNRNTQDQEYPFSQSQNRNDNQGFSRTDKDPFANDGGQIDISDDELPF